MVDLPPGPAAIEFEPILMVSQTSCIETKGLGTYRSLICFDMVKNACSTLVAFLAEVSRKGMPSSSAKAL
jgi:hypothetical protein